MGPSLLNILCKTLAQVEQSEQPGNEEHAVGELRKRLALSVGELELQKAERRAIARKLYLVTPRNYGILRTGAEDEKPTELIALHSACGRQKLPDKRA